MKKAQIQLAPKLVPVFQGPARYRGARGGRGSSKTRGFATMAAVDGYRLGRAGVSGAIMCAREHLNSLDESSLEEVKQAIIATPWLNAYYEIGEKYVRSKDGNIKFTFTGLRHNITAIKGKARILRCWVDEAEDVSEIAWRTLIPTIRDQAEDSSWQSEIWITWNPANRDSATNKRFIQNPPESAKIVELNWQDNPWFPESMEIERQEDYVKRPDTYDHVWEGQYLTITEAQIFKDHFEVRAFEPEDSWSGPYHGLDFGFSQDPTAAVQTYVYDNVLYIRREAVKKKLALDATAPFLAQQIPQMAMHVIRADSARPESINYLSRHGMPRIVGAKKGKGSVEDGIEHIKSYDRVVIHPDCAETAREFRNYSYKIDRMSGDILPIIVDANNHCIDSVRYALEPMIRMASKPRVRSL